MRCAVANDLEGCPFDCEHLELGHTCGKAQAGGEWVLVHVFCEHEDVCKIREEEGEDD